MSAIFWIILSIILIMLEVIAPGVFLLWIGLACLSTFIITFLLKDILNLSGFIFCTSQAIWFAISCIVLMIYGRIFYKKKLKNGDTSYSPVGGRFDSYVGKEYELEESIIAGTGKIKIGDSLWEVRGQDTEKGTFVTIKERKGGYFIVE